MKGKWLFAALASLSGALAGLHAPLLLVLSAHLVWIRIFMLKKRPVILASAALYGLGFFSGFWQSATSHTVLQAGSAQLTVRFKDYPKIDGNHIKGTADAGKEKILFQYYANQETDLENLKNIISPGTICTAGGELEAPEPNRNPSMFNYREYLAHQHIHWIFQADRILSCGKPPHQWRSVFKQIRHTLLLQIENTFPERTAPYAEALLLGEQENFDDSVYQLYQRLGVVHLLAISGLHVQLVAGACFYLLIRIGITRERAAICLMLILPVYAVLCGLNPPVSRSAAMSVLLLLSAQKKLPVGILDALSICFILFLLKDVFILYNIGFQLSFAVCLALLLSGGILENMRGALKKGLAISFISQLAAVPVLCYSFYEFSAIGLLSNLVYIPLYTYILLPLAVLAFASEWLAPPLFSFFSSCFNWMVALSEKMGEMIDTRWSTVLTGKPPLWVLILIAAAIVYGFVLMEGGKKIIRSVLPLVFIIFCLILSENHPLFGEVTFIDVGQGDSILIRLPLGRGTYLIDTGGTVQFEKPAWKKRKNPFEVGKDIVVPFLKSKGIGTIDKLILTHSDEDHIGGAAAVIRSLRVKEIHISPHSWEKPLMRKMLAHAAQKKIPVYEMKNGNGWRNNFGVFQYVSPFDSKYEGNNGSLVLYAAMGGKTWLFTGDLEQEGEEKLVAAYPALHIDVLKAGHHGSKTSTGETLLRQYKPSVVVISVGKDNRFGHPNQEVIRRLKKAHVLIFRTDEDGAVQYRFFKERGTFLTVLP
ncbi:DNA internalization-related competence protein ComEC/Rec2 [Weizmannia acidilactici]|uniref:DNA internalization-related competence protein ComEC/Rec2 n=1 Tax=Weizmannia acidilactici TaxID=2607726 RepID=A0A5J4JKW4_9BACI|nr:DNA internalization-related competence protein ComEC/Rec2 [Weizmannia acidilactici]GER66960.1 DNA internalization-related competence protein ComEC/Rec2 [Weizmannia acidilactici]GER69614.1 DNA internalization-related competence protein ComEC/Rec2 [Weizmannia acidilactici]GER72709.1 DNA internalization-related competence protein ComEC/Rec2 [Weizmannia acidilactici]